LNGLPVGNSSCLKFLSPIIDETEGVIRKKGRIDAAPFVSYEFKHPIILDRHHRITSLVIQLIHERVFHANSETVVAEIRQRFWITQIRVAVQSVGVDFFGPMMVVLGRRQEKRWGVIFKCLVIRAMHLELAHGLDTDSCIIAIRNFILRRGVPKMFISDNGTNLRGAET
jgi:hypothetical protein